MAYNWKDNLPDGGVLLENSTLAPLATFNAADDGGVDAVSYGIDSSDTYSHYLFEIDNNGVLFPKSLLNDYENDIFVERRSNRLFTATVNAYSGDGTVQLTGLFVLTLQDVDEPAEWVGTPFAGGSIAENNPENYGPVVFNATDGDGATITYSLSGDDVAYFSFNANTGELYLKSSLDFEDTDHGVIYSVTVNAASTDGGTTINQAVIVTVTDVNEGVEWETNPTGNAGEVLENIAVGTSVAAFVSTDPEGAADALYGLAAYFPRFGLFGGSQGQYFNIDKDTGVITTKSELDFEEFTHYTLNVLSQAGDKSLGTEVISHIFVLTVTDDVSDNVATPTPGQTVSWGVFGPPDSGNTIDENVTSTEYNALANFIAKSSSGGSSNITYGLSGDAANYFSIVSGLGEALRFKSAFDYESTYGQSVNNRYSVVITANTTEDGIALTHLFILTINDVDETVSWSSYTGQPASGTTINENAAHGESLAHVNATGDSINYGLSGDNANYFSIVPSFGNQLHFKSAFDYESTYGQSINNRYSVVITASNESDSITSLFILTINDVDETPSWHSSLSPDSGKTIDENVTPGGDGLTDFIAESSSGNINYGLSGDAANYFTINNFLVNELVFKSAFDYESTYGQSINNRYSVVITASNDSDTLTHLYILTVNDVAESEPTTWQNGGNPSGIAIAENYAVVGAGPIVFNATDGDGVAVTYSLSGDDAVYFTITPFGGGGGLYLKSSLDFEDTNHGTLYSVIVNATSTDGSPAISQLYVLTVTDDVSDNTVIWGSFGPPDSGNTIDENVTSTEYNALANFIAESDGSISNITYGLSGDAANYFFIGGGWGYNLRFKSAFDYESTYGQSVNNRYSVVITANTTEDGIALTHLFVLTINDVDESGKVLDGTTDNLGGISDGGDVDGLAITGNDLSVTQYDSVSATNITHTLNNPENFEQSFVGYTDADGNTQNHWFFVRDDAGDNTGHIVFDADGLDVNLESLANGGATTTPDQINLLAGINFETDGDFNKPDDLNLDLNGNNAASLTHDQFLALIGGSNNIDFI